MPKTISKWKVINTPLVYMDDTINPAWYIFSYLSIDFNQRKAALTRLEVYNQEYLDKFFRALKLYLKSFGINTLEISLRESNLGKERFFPDTLYWYAGPVMCDSESLKGYFEVLDLERYYVYEFGNQKMIKNIIDYFTKEDYQMVPNLNPLIKKFGDNIPETELFKSEIHEWKITPLNYYPIHLSYYDPYSTVIDKLQLTTKVLMKDTVTIDTFFTCTLGV
ncbi:TPA: hypothetical protein ROX98_001164 [Bacillus pseudomycoides]|nr:hypothetical protein [Bacillus pseudomycoides]